MLLRVGAHRRDVEAVGVVDAAGDVRDGKHRSSLLDQLLRGDPADVAEALDDAALLGELPAETLARAPDHHHDAGAGRLVPEDRAADRDRLAGHDLGDGETALHRVRVHHPRHRLLVRGHVRGRDVLLRADDRQELRGEAPGEPLELGLRHDPRVAADAALRSAVGKTEQRALPGHPHRERGAFAEGDLGVVADPALGRPEHARVLDAVPHEDDAAAVVETHGAADDERALRVAQPLGDVLVDAGVRDRLVVLRDRGAVERRVELELSVKLGLVDARHGAGSLAASRGREPARGHEEPRAARIECRGWDSNPDVPSGQPLLRRPRLTGSATPAHGRMLRSAPPSGLGSTLFRPMSVALALVVGAALGGLAVRGLLRSRLLERDRYRDDLLAAERELIAAEARLLTAESTIDERFTHAIRAVSAEALKENATAFADQAMGRLDQYVKPLKESLQKVETNVQTLEEHRQRDYGALHKEVELLRQSSDGLRTQTGNLAVALRGNPQTRGQWGEIQLRRVIEIAGMLRHCDFAEQQSITGGDGNQLRPDVIVHLPGGQEHRHRREGLARRLPRRPPRGPR